jgi:transposase-like protein
MQLTRVYRICVCRKAGRGRFRTEVFQQYQRSEKALVAVMLEMYVQRVSTRKVKNISEEALRARVQFLNHQPDCAEAR